MSATLERPAVVGEILAASLEGCGSPSIQFMTEEGPISGSGVDPQMVKRAIDWIEAENAKL